MKLALLITLLLGTILLVAGATSEIRAFEDMKKETSSKSFAYTMYASVK